MIFKFTMIGGMMLGVEFLWDQGITVIDLFVVRIFIGKIKRMLNDE